MSVQIVEGIIGAIQKRIDEYEEIANDLAHDYIQSDKPFPTDLKQRYETIGNLAEGLIEAVGIIMQVDYKRDDENKRLREALEKIATRKMSCYLSTSDMNQDFIRIAIGALEGEHHEPSTR